MILSVFVKFCKEATKHPKDRLEGSKGSKQPTATTLGFIKLSHQGKTHKFSAVLSQLIMALISMKQIFCPFVFRATAQ